MSSIARLFVACLFSLPLSAYAAPGDDADPTASVAPDRERLREIEVEGGEPIRGYIEDIDEKTLEVRLFTGGVILLPREYVVSIRDVRVRAADTTMRFLDPNRTRYFYTPSAMMLKEGEGYFSQKALIFSAVAFGLTDHVTILAGGVVPLWLSGPKGFNFIGAIKVGGEIAPDVHVAGGAETFILPPFDSGAALTTLGFVFGNLTFGDRDAHVTVAGGYPFAMSGDESRLGSLIVTLNGNLRLGNRVALISENWFMTGNGARLFVLDSIGIRLINRSVAWDFGLIGLPTEEVGVFLPWVDFTYNF